MEAQRSAPFSGQFSPKGLQEVMWVVGRRRSVIAFMVLVLCTGALVLLNGPESLASPTVALATYGPLAIPVVIFPLALHFWQKSLFRRHPMALQPIFGSLTADGVQWNIGEEVRSNIPWRLLHKAHLLDSVIALYVSPQQVYPLPRNFFSNEEDWRLARELVADGMRIGRDPQ